MTTLYIIYLPPNYNKFRSHILDEIYDRLNWNNMTKCIGSEKDQNLLSY
jgi:hypothetical protein